MCDDRHIGKCIIVRQRNCRQHAWGILGRFSHKFIAFALKFSANGLIIIRLIKKQWRRLSYVDIKGH